VTGSHAPGVRDSGGLAATASGADPLDVKFAVPLATHVVSRPRLHARLTAGLQSCCTLIAAPAGWGKTLLAGSWLAEGGADRAAAWVSLGPADDDVRALWTAVATAIAPVIGERAAADLRQVVTDDDVENMPGRVAAALADDGTPVVLVLDNLHEIDRAVGTRPGDPHAVAAVALGVDPAHRRATVVVQDQAVGPSTRRR
jgi:LuxR family transcriptional regulator, maltose regulon positive regulatory protein